MPIDVHLVPTQLIEAAINFAIFAGLLWLRKRRAFDGQIIFTYLIVYSVARFTIEFWRDDPRGELLGLSTSQFISVLLFLFGLVMTVYHWRRKPAERVSASPDPAAQAS